MIRRVSPAMAISLAVVAAACKQPPERAEPPPPTREVAAPAPVQDAAPPPVERDAAPGARRIDLPPAPPIPLVPRGLPSLPAPVARGLSPDRVALGRLLFFDRRLSRDRSTACASCHDPAHGFADPRTRSPTAAGKPNLRHTPSLYNLAWAPALYWDGRGASLEAVIAGHWRGQLAADASQTATARAARALARIPEYRAHFERAFGRPPDADAIADALAAFVRTLWSAGSPWDRHEAGEPDAVSDSAVAGFQVFSEVGQCGLCHAPPLYTDFRYHDLGVGADGPADPGRALVTGAPGDRGAFRTPTLRGVALTAPYFHDGSAVTLDAVLDHKLAQARRATAAAGDGGRGDGAALEVAAPAAPADLSPVQRRDLIAFLRALTPEPAGAASMTEPPRLPPDPTGPTNGD